MPTKKQDFETNLKELENVVKALESGEVSLDEMLQLFENGIKLTKNCTKLLDEAEQKITVLMKEKDSENLVEEPFSGIGE